MCSIEHIHNILGADIKNALPFYQQDFLPFKKAAKKTVYPVALNIKNQGKMPGIFHLTTLFFKKGDRLNIQKVP